MRGPVTGAPPISRDLRVGIRNGDIPNGYILIGDAPIEAHHGGIPAALHEDWRHSFT